MEERTGPDGDSLYVDRTAGNRGSKSPFFVVYRDPAANRRWGYVCGNCGSFDTAMDSMGRIECGSCHNVTKPDEWDAAHE